MDYEKKYKNALERAKKFIEANPLVQNLDTWIKETFPELAESESERIRKALIHEFEGWNKRFPADTFAGFTSKEILAWLEKQGEQKPNPYSGTSFEHNGHTWGMCARDNGVDILLDKQLFKHLEKQDEQKQEINNFDVLPGLYKCVHRMFDGTPDGRLLFEVDNVYRCLSKHDRAEFEVSYGHSVYLEDPVVCKHFIPFEKQDEVESDNDDIEAEEKGIRKAFNKIWEEKQDKQKSQRMISAEAKEAMYDKPADTVEQKCEESKTKVFDAPTPFEDKLYAFVLACEILVDPSKREFILEHSQEILDAAREQIGKEQSSTWSKEDDFMLDTIEGWLDTLCEYLKDSQCEYIPNVKYCIDRLKSLKQRMGR